MNRIRLTEQRRELILQVRWCISKRASEEDTDGRTRVTTDDRERVLDVD